MKITKTASGKQEVKLSKQDWINIGKKAGWMNKQAQAREMRFYCTNCGKRWEQNVYLYNGGDFAITDSSGAHGKVCIECSKLPKDQVTSPMDIHMQAMRDQEDNARLEEYYANLYED